MYTIVLRLISIYLIVHRNNSDIGKCIYSEHLQQSSFECSNSKYLIVLLLSRFSFT